MKYRNPSVVTSIFGMCRCGSPPPGRGIGPESGSGYRPDRTGDGPTMAPCRACVQGRQTCRTTARAPEISTRSVRAAAAVTNGEPRSAQSRWQQESPGSFFRGSLFGTCAPAAVFEEGGDAGGAGRRDFNVFRPEVSLTGRPPVLFDHPQPSKRGMLPGFLSARRSTFFSQVLLEAGGVAVGRRFARMEATHQAGGFVPEAAALCSYEHLNNPTEGDAGPKLSCGFGEEPKRVGPSRTDESRRDRSRFFF